MKLNDLKSRVENVKGVKIEKDSKYNLYYIIASKDADMFGYARAVQGLTYINYLGTIVYQLDDKEVIQVIEK